MDGYELSEGPFFFNQETNIKLYQARNKSNERVVAKYHDIQYVDKAELIEKFNLMINACIAQARVEHLHNCKIQEIYVDFDQALFSVNHILEALDKELEKERKRDRRVSSEAEIREFLAQTAQVLAYVHSKRIAHLDIKPDNIFLDWEGAFKVGDFGTFFERKASLPANTAAGTLPYMSPQKRKRITGEVQGYNAFKKRCL